ATFLPAHFAVLDLKRRAGLFDFERGGRRAVRHGGGGIEVGIFARDRRIAVDIDEIEDFAGGEVDMRGHTFHGVRVVVFAGSVIGGDANDAPRIVERQGEINGRPGDRGYEVAK